MRGATGLRTQHPSTMQICVVVGERNGGQSCRQLLVAVAFLWDEKLLRRLLALALRKFLPDTQGLKSVEEQL